MSKELIEKLREDGKFLGGNFGKLMHEAADALEAKAAPVGEREAFEEWCEESGQYVKSPVVFEAFQAGAAYQRAPQPSAGMVMPERQSPEDDWHYVMRERSHGWNACLDEFARLNKGAGSHE